MSRILVSIRPEYVGKILSGEKGYEYRKRVCAKSAKSMVIYSTYPQMEVVAEVEILDTLLDSPTALWERTKQNAGISRARFREYFKGRKVAYAYKLGHITLFNPAKKLDDYGVTAPPQSFVYIFEDF